MDVVTLRALDGSLRLDEHPPLPVTVLVRHRSLDAGRVELSVVMHEDEHITFPVDRGLLTAGVTTPVADGDVAVSVETDQVVVQVGEFGLLLRLADIVDVLLETYVAAPTGSEPDVVITLTAARELSQA